MVTDIRKPYGYTFQNSHGARRLKAALGFLMIYLSLLPAGCSVKPCYIAVAEKSESKPEDPELRTINFFFDRTNSVSGFVGDVASPTGYNQALDIALVESGEIAEPGFYEFGEIGIYRILNDTRKMREEVRKREFYAGGRYINGVYTITSSYNPSWDRTRELVRNNAGDRYPFSAVLDYITNQENPHETINFIVSDLYEQNGFNESFYRLFRYAFQNGLAGALFAVKSAYNGHISDFTPDPNENPIDVDNGESTVFFFIIGPGNALQDYCKILSTQLAAANPAVHFDRAIFLLNAGFRASAGATDKRRSANKPAGNEKQFARAGSAVNINLNNTPKAIQVWQETLKGGKKIYVPNSADAEAYRIMKKDVNARYVYITPKREEYSGSVPEIRDTSIEFLSQERLSAGKTERGKLSPPFNSANTGNFSTPAATDDKGFNYLPIVINSRNLSNGVYRVRFNIVPDWVNFLNAGTVTDLKTSVEQKYSPVKVLNLRLIYENILREYTEAGGYTAEFYLVKG
jgi:hypothetical protein